MDCLFETATGSITYWDIRNAIASEVQAEISDPVVKTFQNLWRIDRSEIMNFDPFRPSQLGKSFVAPDDLDDNLSVDSAMGGWKLHSPNRYFYRISKYESSTFYCKFLYNQPVCSLCGHIINFLRSEK